MQTAYGTKLVARSPIPANLSIAPIGGDFPVQEVFAFWFGVCFTDADGTLWERWHPVLIQDIWNFIVCIKGGRLSTLSPDLWTHPNHTVTRTPVLDRVALICDSRNPAYLSVTHHPLPFSRTTATITDFDCFLFDVHFKYFGANIALWEQCTSGHYANGTAFKNFTLALSIEVRTGCEAIARLNRSSSSTLADNVCLMELGQLWTTLPGGPSSWHNDEWTPAVRADRAAWTKAIADSGQDPSSCAALLPNPDLRLE